MQRRLGDQRVVVVAPEHSRPLERPNDDRDRLELSPTLRDRLLVDDEGLNVELVGEFLETCFVGDLGGEEEQSETGFGGFDAVVEDGDDLVDELEDGGEFGFPGVVLEREKRRKGKRSGSNLDASLERSLPSRTHLLFLDSPVPTSELDTGGNKRREGVSYAISSVRKVLPRRLKELQKIETKRVSLVSLPLSPHDFKRKPKTMYSPGTEPPNRHS